MPKYYCDYCDTYLTHDSPSVRRTHSQGRKHKDNVREYYQKWMEEQAQRLIDQTTALFKTGRMPPQMPPPGLPPLMIPPPPLHLGMIPPPPFGVLPPPIFPPFLPPPATPLKSPTQSSSDEKSPPQSDSDSPNVSVLNKSC